MATHKQAPRLRARARALPSRASHHPLLARRPSKPTPATPYRRQAILAGHGSNTSSAALFPTRPTGMGNPSPKPHGAVHHTHFLYSPIVESRRDPMTRRWRNTTTLLLPPPLLLLHPPRTSPGSTRRGGNLGRACFAAGQQGDAPPRRRLRRQRLVVDVALLRDKKARGRTACLARLRRASSVFSLLLPAGCCRGQRHDTDTTCGRVRVCVPLHACVLRPWCCRRDRPVPLSGSRRPSLFLSLLFSSHSTSQTSPNFGHKHRENPIRKPRASQPSARRPARQAANHSRRVRLVPVCLF
jgi:hypothetical protein